ncbi:hypothetical protein [Paracraurococcus ruber]|uniref:Calcium-binding protein n=1 Tax=Paracraurococcus ruber TaxID=77675 RepID=A0ABS1D0M7_9PROT|nr:hypothetical protein [Paracraurococcus ruber]MBK1660250.1 hypothetical protein [Paracraurococcus ruber]TDG31875.1 hypothetical protein E2C05_09475 [Paracraurococcus ruber]
MVLPLAVDLAHLSYAEGSGPTLIDTAALVTGSGSYRGGSLTFTLSPGGNVGETLALMGSGTADTAAGAISVVGTTVYRGTGSGAEEIGSVDATLDGQDGTALRINFNGSGFPNGSFDQGADGDVVVTGWTAETGRTRLDGVATIAGWATPIDTTYPAQNTTGDFSTDMAPGTGAAATLSSAYAAGPGDLSVRLDTDQLSINQPYGVIRGPVVYSEGAVSLAANDVVSFAWKALGTGDAYDAYGYLLNVDTGATITLLDSTGSSGGVETDWTTETLTLTAGQEGSYRFVFVAGSFDASGGQFLGGTLMIDDVTVTVSIPPSPLTADEVAAVARLLRYDNPNSGHTANTTTLTSTVVDESGGSATDTSTIWLSTTYAGPVASLQNQWTGTAGSDYALGTGDNDFIALGAGDDAATGGDGDDVIDGGTGSNFLAGGDGWDRFFLDLRGNAGPTWSTIIDFATGEQVAVWGWRQGVSTLTRVDSDGAVGWQGATAHIDVDGDKVVDGSITWTGRSWGDLPVPIETSVAGTGLLWFA